VAALQAEYAHAPPDATWHHLGRRGTSCRWCRVQPTDAELIRSQASGDQRFDLVELVAVRLELDLKIVAALQIHPEPSEVPNARDNRSAVSVLIARFS
jgi:hypothetical protein